jgi:hypothetical protein
MKTFSGIYGTLNSQASPNTAAPGGISGTLSSQALPNTAASGM